MKCPDCSGKGYKHIADNKMFCGKCNGTGKVEPAKCTGHMGTFRVENGICQTCGKVSEI